MQHPTKEKLAVFNRTRQSFLGLGVTVADTHFGRLRGILGRRELQPGEGLWVVPSQGIHTIGMRFPIDVLYLDEHFHVIHLIQGLGPFRVGPVRMDCHSVLELPARTIYLSQSALGDELLIGSPAEMEIHWKALRAREVEVQMEDSNSRGPR